MSSWRQLDRVTLVDTKFLKVYQDTVELPNGQILDDYTVVKKNDIVVVVATDRDGRVIVFDEYKYAAGTMMPSLPAGQIEVGESFEKAAERELLEETGFGGGEYEVIDVLREYPTKDLHTLSIVRARNVVKQKEVHHEMTETIEPPRFITLDELKEQLRSKKWKSASAIAALMVAMPELLG